MPFYDLKERLGKMKGTRWGRFVLAVIISGIFFSFIFTLMIISFLVLTHNSTFAYAYDPVHLFQAYFLAVLFLTVGFSLFMWCWLEIYANRIDKFSAFYLGFFEKRKTILLSLWIITIVPLMFFLGVKFQENMQSHEHFILVLGTYSYLNETIDDYARMGNFIKAQEIEEKTLRFIDANKDAFWGPDTSKGRALARLSVLNKKMGDLEKSDAYMKQAQELLKKGGWNDVSVEKIEKWVEKSWQ